MKVVNTNEEAMKYSAWGMGLFEVNREQIEQLLQGKILVDDDPGEYGTMIVLVDQIKI